MSEKSRFQKITISALLYHMMASTSLTSRVLLIAHQWRNTQLKPRQLSKEVKESHRTTD